MTEGQANAIFDILVAECGAIISDRYTFVHYVTHDGTEYRFQGVFGFGGKFRPKTMSIDYYPEDQTAERDQIQAKVNKKLAELGDQEVKQ